MSVCRVSAERRVHLMKPPLLAELLRDTAAVAERAVQLKQLLPRINVSAMASKQPELLLQVDPAVLHGWPALHWLLCCVLCLLCALYLFNFAH